MLSDATRLGALRRRTQRCVLLSLHFIHLETVETLFIAASVVEKFSPLTFLHVNIWEHLARALLRLTKLRRLTLWSTETETFRKINEGG